MFVRFVLVCLLSIVLTDTNVTGYQTYSQHQLWRLHMKNNEQVEHLLAFSRTAYRHGINFWSEEFRMHVPVSVAAENRV
jgi:hypothetical protein